MSSDGVLFEVGEYVVERAPYVRTHTGPLKAGPLRIEDPTVGIRDLVVRRSKEVPHKRLHTAGTACSPAPTHGNAFEESYALKAMPYPGRDASDCCRWINVSRDSATCGDSSEPPPGSASLTYLLAEQRAHGRRGR
jgi:hypothetical protein